MWGRAPPPNVHGANVNENRLTLEVVSVLEISRIPAARSCNANLTGCLKRRAGTTTTYVAIRNNGDAQRPSSKFVLARLRCMGDTEYRVDDIHSKEFLG